MCLNFSGYCCRQNKMSILTQSMTVKAQLSSETPLQVKDCKMSGDLTCWIWRLLLGYICFITAFKRGFCRRTKARSQQWAQIADADTLGDGNRLCHKFVQCVPRAGILLEGVMPFNGFSSLALKDPPRLAHFVEQPSSMVSKAEIKFHSWHQQRNTETILLITHVGVFSNICERLKFLHHLHMVNHQLTIKKIEQKPLLSRHWYHFNLQMVYQ